MESGWENGCVEPGILSRVRAGTRWRTVETGTGVFAHRPNTAGMVAVAIKSHTQKPTARFLGWSSDAAKGLEPILSGFLHELEAV